MIGNRKLRERIAELERDTDEYALLLSLFPAQDEREGVGFARAMVELVGEYRADKLRAEATLRGVLNAEPSAGIALFAAERARQRDDLWGDDHDDEHTDFGLTKAAVCYAMHDIDSEMTDDLWPWDSGYWKPRDAIRNRVKAGTLLASEVDRLLRLEGDEG